MGLGLPLLATILAMAVLVGLVVAGAFFLMRPRRLDSRTAGELLEITYDMIGGPDCEGCRRADHTHGAKPK